MSDELNDPLFERLGPVVLRLLAMASAVVIVSPMALVALLPLCG